MRSSLTKLGSKLLQMIQSGLDQTMYINQYKNDNTEKNVKSTLIIEP